MAFFSSFGSLFTRKGKVPEGPSRDPAEAADVDASTAQTGKRKDPEPEEPTSDEKSKKWKPSVDISTKTAQREHLISWRIQNFLETKDKDVPPEFCLTVADPKGIQSNWTFKLLHSGTPTSPARLERKLNWVEGWSVEVDRDIPMPDDDLIRIKIFRDDDAPHQRSTLMGPTVDTSVDVQISNQYGTMFLSRVGEISTIMMTNHLHEIIPIQWDNLARMTSDEGDLVIKLKFWVYATIQTTTAVDEQGSIQVAIN